MLLIKLVGSKIFFLLLIRSANKGHSLLALHFFKRSLFGLF